MSKPEGKKECDMMLLSSQNRKKRSKSHAMDGAEDDVLWLDDDVREDGVPPAQLIPATPENVSYDDQVSAWDWDLLCGASDDEEEDDFHRS